MSVRTGRLQACFADAAQAGRGVLIAYATTGDPDLATTELLVDRLVDAGVDVVELGVPFSDPVADGPTIQAASVRALSRGVTLDDVLQTAARIHQRHPHLPLVLMGYANPFYQMGLDQAAVRSAEAGVDAWIVPDVPFEESRPYAEALGQHGLGFVPLLAPTTPTERAEQIVAKLAPPFVYYVSVTGVTGARKGFTDGWHTPLDALRARTERPFAVGFGISSPQLAAEACAHAEGAVVGSAIIDRLAEGGVEAAAAFVAELREAI